MVSGVVCGVGETGAEVVLDFVAAGAAAEVEVGDIEVAGGGLAGQGGGAGEAAGQGEEDGGGVHFEGGFWGLFERAGVRRRQNRFSGFEFEKRYLILMGERIASMNYTRNLWRLIYIFR